MGDQLSVLEKLRIPKDSGDDFPPEKYIDSDDEFEEGFPDGILEENRDPAPGEAPTRKARAAAAKPRPDVARITKKHRDEAQEEVETFLEMLALAWGWQAPPCGDALEAAAPDIAAKVTRLLARNPKWLLRVREGGVLADAIGIAVAFKPVVQVAWGHYTQPSGGDEGAPVFDPARFPPYSG